MAAATHGPVEDTPIQEEFLLKYYTVSLLSKREVRWTTKTAQVCLSLVRFSQFYLFDFFPEEESEFLRVFFSEGALVALPLSPFCLTC